MKTTYLNTKTFLVAMISAFTLVACSQDSKDKTDEMMDDTEVYVEKTSENMNEMLEEKHESLEDKIEDKK